MYRAFHSAVTLEEGPESTELERKRREWGLIERLSKGQTSEGFDMYAECTTCRAPVSQWRAHLHKISDFDTKSQEGSSALLTYPAACSACGGSVVAVRAEPVVSRPGDPRRT
jgi:hypothetical protein